MSDKLVKCPEGYRGDQPEGYSERPEAYDNNCAVREDQFADHSVVFVGGFGKTGNKFVSAYLDSGKTTSEQRWFGSLGAYYRLPILAGKWFALNAHLGLVYNFSGGDRKELSTVMLDTNLEDTRIIRTTTASISNLNFLDLPRVGFQLGIKKDLC